MSFIKFIYEEYRQDVFVYLVSLTRNSTLSEDLVSENSIRVIDFRTKKNRKDVGKGEVCEMTKISCEVCLDLIPLVKNNMASEDSTNLVQEHIRECESCKKEFDSMAGIPPEMNDKQVLRKIKNQIFLAVLIIVIIGALIGIGLTEGPGLFYNIIIMPLIGAIAYLTLNKKTYYFSIGLFILSYFWILIKYVLDGSFANNRILDILPVPMFWSFIYSGLALLGITIAFLLKFAFRRGIDYEKDN